MRHTQPVEWVMIKYLYPNILKYGIFLSIYGKSKTLSGSQKPDRNIFLLGTTGQTLAPVLDGAIVIEVILEM